MSRFTVVGAVRALASVPDKKMGFRPDDVAFGKRLADIPEDWWSPAIKREAWRMLESYRDELARVFIPFDAIAEPPAVEERLLREARQSANLIATNRAMVPEIEAAKKITLTSDGRLRITFHYNPQISAAVSDLPMRAYDTTTRSWIVPNDTKTVLDVVAFAQKWGFLITLDAQDAMRPVLFKAKQYAAQPKAGPQTALIPRDWEKNQTVRRIDLVDGHFIVKFPYNKSEVDMLDNSVPGGRKSFVTVKETGEKFWKFKADPVTAMALYGFAQQAKIPLTDIATTYMEKIGEEMRLRIEASHAEDADLEIPGLGGTLMPFQRGGVRYLVRAKRAICADQPGLGKTIQALAALHVLQAFPAAIIVPAIVKYNWEDEARIWLPGKKVIVCKSNTPQELIDDADIIIANYDIVHAEPVDKAKKRGKWRATGLLRRIMDADPVGVVFDESHRLKNNKARRSKAAQLLAQDRTVAFLLTGTAVLNKPKDLVHQLRVINRLNDLGGERGVTQRHTLVLNKALRGVCMIRRRKSNVMKELPPKVRTVIKVDIDNRKEYAQAERDLIAWMMDRFTDEETRDKKIDAAMRAEILVKLATLNRLAAEGKVAAVKKWLADFLESGEKIVVFAHHIDIVTGIAAEFNAPTVYGGTSDKDREAAKLAFQRCNRCGLKQDKHTPSDGDHEYEPDMRTPMIVLNLTSGGEGITLTSASDVALVEFPWHSAGSDQAEDRCHRKGQTDSVNSWWFVGKGTIDEERVAVIEEKRQMSGETLDGEDWNEEADLSEERKKEVSAQMEVLKRLRARLKEQE